MDYKKWLIISLALIIIVAASARAGYYYRNYQIAKDIKQQEKTLEIIENSNNIKSDFLVGEISSLDGNLLTVISEYGDESTLRPISLTLDQKVIILQRVNIVPNPFAKELADLLAKTDSDISAQDRRNLFDQYQRLLDKSDAETIAEQERLEKILPTLKDTDPVMYNQTQQKIDSIVNGYTLLTAKPEELVIGQKVMVKYQAEQVLSLEIF